MIASTLPFDPTLDSISPLLSSQQQAEHVDQDQIFYPATDEEFQEMVEMWGD